jgi:hypothetical protein
LKKKTGVSQAGRNGSRAPLDAMAGHWLEALVVVALVLRQGEVLGLREDVDLEREEVHVRRALQRLRGQRPQEVDLKTDMSRRTVALPVFVAETLRVHQDRQGGGQRLLTGARSIRRSGREPCRNCCHGVG